MANYNRVVLLGRLTADPDIRTFANGGKVAKFRFAAASGRRKNQMTGQYEDEKMFVDCEAFNRGENGTLANIVEEYLRKGALILIEGRLGFEQWDDRNGGGKRSKHKIIVDAIQMVDTRTKDEREGGGQRRESPAGSGRPTGGYGGGGRRYENTPDSDAPSSEQEDGEAIPF